MMGSIYLAMSLLGWIHFIGFAWQFDPLPVVLGQTLLFLLIFIIVGWSEELLSRGYHLQTLTSGINLFWGVLISSAVFGALHLSNPHASWVRPQSASSLPVCSWRWAISAPASSGSRSGCISAGTFSRGSSSASRSAALPVIRSCAFRFPGRRCGPERRSDRRPG